MANLNFQQQPRSVANQGLTSRTAAFNTNSLSGHVTPTGNLFPGVAAATGLSSSSFAASQPLSPIRSLAAGGIPGGAGRGTFNAASSAATAQQVGSGGATAGGGAAAQRQPFSASQEKRTGAPTLSGLAATNTAAVNSAVAMVAGLNNFTLPMRQYGSQVGGTAAGSTTTVNVNNFHSVFGSMTGDNTGTPPLLDLSEFPSLTNRGQPESMPQPNPMPGKQPYVGMVKQPQSDQTEFQMSNEDFPALPGTTTSASTSTSAQSSSSTTDKGSGGGGGGGGGGEGNDISHDPHGLLSSRIVGAEKMAAAGASGGVRRGIQTTADGKITHIPPSMVRDQFGMVGLLQFIRAAETDSNLMQLALGQDLTTLGLNLNVPDILYPTFAGPWAEHQCQPHEIDVNGPPEYLIYAGVKDKLGTVTLGKYKEDVLFYLFYAFVGDFMQVMAAAELYDRDWRYHIEEKVWISLVDGTYYYFDPTCWRKVMKDFHIDASKLESRPNLSQHLLQ